MNELPSPLERRIAALESRVAKLVEKLDRKGPQPAKPEPPDHWPQAPEGYRRLENGETIQSGDCWIFASGTVPVQSQMIGDPVSTQPFLPIVRPIAEPAKPEPDAPKYRRLAVGERVQPGDVFFRNDSVFEPANSIGYVIREAKEQFFRAINNNPEPIAKPRRSPVEVVKEHLELYEPTTFGAVALRAVITELQQEGYE